MKGQRVIHLIKGYFSWIRTMLPSLRVRGLTMIGLIWHHAKASGYKIFRTICLGFFKPKIWLKTLPRICLSLGRGPKNLSDPWPRTLRICLSLGRGPKNLSDPWLKTLRICLTLSRGPKNLSDPRLKLPNP